MNRDIFTGFLAEVSALLGDAHPCNIIFDNARAHLNVVNPSEYHACVSLPPYYPQLNPVELAFSTLKAEIKRRLATMQDESNIPPVNINLAQHRRALLTQVAHDSMGVITVDKCRAWYAHCRRFIPDSMDERNFTT